TRWRSCDPDLNVHVGSRCGLEKCVICAPSDQEVHKTVARLDLDTLADHPWKLRTANRQPGLLRLIATGAQIIDHGENLAGLRDFLQVRRGRNRGGWPTVKGDA